MAIAHDDDLRIVENIVRPRKMFVLGDTSKTRTQEVFTADAVAQFLHENQTPVLLENGGIYTMLFHVKREVLKLVSTVAFLHDQDGDMTPVFGDDDERAIFSATAELRV